MIPTPLHLIWPDEHVIEALGWTLVHSLWQVAGLAVLLWIGAGRWA